MKRDSDTATVGDTEHCSDDEEKNSARLPPPVRAARSRARTGVASASSSSVDAAAVLAPVADAAAPAATDSAPAPAAADAAAPAPAPVADDAEVSVENKNSEPALLAPAIAMPKHWSMLPRSPRRGEGEVCILQEPEAMRELVCDWMKANWDPGNVAGAGRTLQHLEVVAVHRVEQFSLMRRYLQCQAQLRFESAVCKRAGGWQTVKPDCATDRLYAKLGIDPDPDLNEHLLMHGTSESAVVSILSTGFDERASGFGSAFGNGIYFAEALAKADIYSGALSADGTRRCIISRVQLGCSAELNGELEHIRRAPCNVAGCKNSRCCHIRLQSVVGKKAKTGADRFRDFVIYDGAQAYPELVVRYKVVAT